MVKPSQCTVTLTALLCLAELHAQPEALPAYEADFEFNYVLPNGDQFTRRGHIYQSADGKVRQDTGNGAILTDLRTGTSTLLIAELSQAHVLTVPPELRTLPDLGMGGRLPTSIEPFEQTTIDGHPVAKTFHVGPQGETQEVWTATDLGVVVFARIEANGATTTQELRNLAVGEPDASVFEVPVDYEVLEVPSRFDRLNIRIPPASDLPFSETTPLVPLPAPAED